MWGGSACGYGKGKQFLNGRRVMGITFFAFCLLSCHDSKWILNVNGAPQALASALAIDIQNPFGVYLRAADKGCVKSSRQGRAAGGNWQAVYLCQNFDDMYIVFVCGMFPKFL